MKVKLSTILEFLKTNNRYGLGAEYIENTYLDQDQGEDIQFFYKGEYLRKFDTDGEFKFTRHIAERSLGLPVIMFNKLNELVDLEDEDLEILSNCCSAPIYDDTDICSECKEHCCGIDAEGNEVEL